MTTPFQLATLLFMGLFMGVLNDRSPAPGPVGRNALAYIEVNVIFWTFILMDRWLEGRIMWQASIGTVLASVLFVVAIYIGRKVRQAFDRRH